MSEEIAETKRGLDPMNVHLLNFVGDGLYTPTTFADEARRLGVNRAFPTWILKQGKLDFGSKVLLGTWKKDPILNPTKEYLKLNPEAKDTKLGRAKVWGAFTVERVNVAGDIALQSKFAEKVKMGKVPIEKDVTVMRACGSYIVRIVYEAETKLPEMLKAFEEAKQETGAEGKLFLSGKYEDVPFPVSLTQPVGFSRAGLLIEYKELSIGAIAKPLVGFLDDYGQRKYLTKKEKVTIGKEVKTT